MNNKKKKTFFSLLIKNQIIITTVFIVAILLIYLLINFESSLIIFEPKYDDLISRLVHTNISEYKNIRFYKYIGKNSNIIIFDDEGSSIYSNKFDNNLIEYNELDYIPSAFDNSYYYSYQYETTLGIKKIITKYKSAYDDNYIYRDLPVAYSVIDEHLTVTEGNLFAVGSKFSQRQLELCIGNFGENKNVTKIQFENNNQIYHAAIILSNQSFQDYADLLYLWEKSWLILIPVYIITVLISLYNLSKKTKKLLNPLNNAIIKYVDNKDVHIKNYKGPEEFVEIVENFNILADRLNKSEQEKNDIDKKKKKMFADITHDLKTPITVIKGYTKAIKDGLIPLDEQKKYLDIISKKSDLLSEMIDHFNEYNKLSHPDFSLQFEKTNICLFCKELIANKYSELEIKGFILNFTIPNYNDICNIDHYQFGRVIDNLIDNSIKYNKEGTTIYFKVKKTDHDILIHIGDNGIGIKKKLKENIFDPFVIGKQERTSGQGTGLGLFIAKEIIERHNGSIILINKPKKPYSVEFVITIPIINS